MDRLSSMQPLSLETVISGIVWVIFGLVIVATKVSFFSQSASIYWEYVGGLMILFGLVRLLWGLVRGSKNTKPGISPRQKRVLEKKEPRSYSKFRDSRPVGEEQKWIENRSFKALISNLGCLQILRREIVRELPMKRQFSPSHLS